MTTTGIRDLRADLAAQVRRAAAGESVTISVGGRRVAVLGPLDGGAAATAIDDLVTSGALVPPRRGDRRVADGAVTVLRTPRFDLLLREVRG